MSRGPFGSPYLRQHLSVGAIMWQVSTALLPGIGLCVWFFGWGVLVHMSVAALGALGLEALMLYVRGRPLRPFLTDGSAVLLGLLLGLGIPPLAPWWTTLIAVSFAVIVAKHLYGGLGNNLFNPAMAGYALLLVSFPNEMRGWPDLHGATHESVHLLDSVLIVFAGHSSMAPDALSGATPLDYLQTRLRQQHMISEIQLPGVFASFGAPGWGWVNFGFLMGGIWLLFAGIIKWHIPAAMLVSLAMTALVFNAVDPDAFAAPMVHLTSGATMLGAFFIATDPVSAPVTPVGRLICGAIIGVLTYVIRTWGSYPDGVAFAVLVMNAATPTIDHYTRPRVFGRGQR